MWNGCKKKSGCDPNGRRAAACGEVWYDDALDVSNVGDETRLFPGHQAALQGAKRARQTSTTAVKQQ